MDQYICNKCYCTQDKVKYPFELTQCGHIFCHNCLRQVIRECPECKSKEIKSASLTELLTPEMSKLSIPLSDILTSIKSLIIFQNEQRNIILECFYQIDDKYQMLKYRYINAVQNKKQITCEYSSLKKYAEGLRKKLMFMKINSINRKTIYKTPYFMQHQDIEFGNSSRRPALNKEYDMNISASKLHRYSAI